MYLAPQNSPSAIVLTLGNKVLFLFFIVTEIWTVELELASEIPSLPDNSILSDSGHTAKQHNYLWELHTTSPPTACFPSSVYFKSLVLNEIWTVELELASETPPLPDSSVFSLRVHWKCNYLWESSTDCITTHCLFPLYCLSL